MKTRLTGVSLSGLKGSDNSTTELAPCTILVGPNGSGKSARAGAIGYALRGRIPGLDASDLSLVQSLPKLDVAVTAALADGGTMHVLRGLSPKSYARAISLLAGGRTEEASTKAAVDARVIQHFGRLVDTYIDVFDPKRGVFSLSADKRLRWAFALAADKSGWTKGEVLTAVKRRGEDPLLLVTDLGDGAVDMLELNLAKAEERLRSSRASAKEYQTAHSALESTIDEPRPGEIEAAEDEEGKTDAEADLAAEVAEVAKTQLQTKRKLADEIRDAERGAQARADILRLQAHRAEVAQHQTEVATELVDHGQSLAGARDRVLRLALDLDALAKKRGCPLCETVLPGVVLERVAGLIREQIGERERQIIQHLDAERELKVEAGHLVAELGALDEQIQARHMSLGELRDPDEVASAKSYLGSMPSDESLEAQVEAADAARDKARAAFQRLFELNRRQALAKERARIAELVKAGKSSEAAAGKLVDALRSVRLEMLEAADGALNRALVDPAALVPHGGRWRFSVSEDGLDFGYDLPSGQRVAFQALSAGEKTVATSLFSMAVEAIRPEPWSAVVVESLELCEPRIRVELARLLADAASRGALANVLLSTSDGRDAALLSSELGSLALVHTL